MAELARRHGDLHFAAPRRQRPRPRRHLRRQSRPRRRDPTRRARAAAAVAVRPRLGRVHPRRTVPPTRPATGARPLRGRAERSTHSPQPLPRRRRDRLVLLTTGAHRRPVRSARRFRRCRQPLEPRRQHARAAHHPAQSRRPPPTSRRARSTGRTSRRRRPHRHPDLRRGSRPTRQRAHLGEHHARRRTIRRTHRRRSQTQHHRHSPRRAQRHRRTTAASKHARQPTDVASPRTTPAATRPSAAPTRRGTGWCVARSSRRRVALNRDRELGTERVARAASPSRATAAAVHDSGPAVHTTPHAPALLALGGRAQIDGVDTMVPRPASVSADGDSGSRCG